MCGGLLVRSGLLVSAALALRTSAPRGARRRLSWRRLPAFGKVFRQRLEVMLHPALLVFLHLAGRQIAVADAHPRPPPGRFELAREPRIAPLGRKTALAARLPAALG